MVDDALQRADGRADPTAVDDARVTEPGSRYIDFLIPGLLGMNLMSAGMWGIGFVIVEMRTRKLLKRLVATPMSQRALPARRSCSCAALFLLVELPRAARLRAGSSSTSACAGSLPLLIAAAPRSARSAFAGLGLLIASRAQNTQTASGLINLVHAADVRLLGRLLLVGALPGGAAAGHPGAAADRAQRRAARR